MTAGTVISVDVMGGDRGPRSSIAGLSRANRENPDLRFVLHGDAEAINKLLIKRPKLREVCDIRHAEDVVPMDEKPSRALRQGRKSSLWQALQCVADGDAKVALSGGNTGAIVAMAMMALRKAPGVDRPAIGILWPSQNPGGFNVMLDVGADVRADADSLLQFAVMGSVYSRLVVGIEKPRVGILNVGSEDMKGRPELYDAKVLLDAAKHDDALDFNFVGFVEGPDILSDNVDVIVTDGFTGNIAMKASEGTAAFIRQTLKDAFSHSILSRLGSLFALTSLRRLKMRIDPRRANGGVFLGLNGAVVKSHGSADAVGFSSAVHLAAKMAAGDLPALVTQQLSRFDMEHLSERARLAAGAAQK
ncbi:MAG: phosphate acyltransferase PlsX [Pseudomonadota bacterium]